MKSRPSRRSFVILRRLIAMLPLRYRCAALLFGTVVLFPFLLLAMSLSFLFSALLETVGAASRWFGDATAFPHERKLELRDLPGTSVTVTEIRG